MDQSDSEYEKESVNLQEEPNTNEHSQTEHLQNEHLQNELEQTFEENIRYVKTQGGIEVIVVENPNFAKEETDVELQQYKSKDWKKIESLQHQQCNVCNESGIEHRILIHCEEDKRRLGIPIVPANESLKFLYRCCVQGCPFQTIRLKNASAFHAHMQKHSTVSIIDHPNPDFVNFLVSTLIKLGLVTKSGFNSLLKVTLFMYVYPEVVTVSDISLKYFVIFCRNYCKMKFFQKC